MKEIDISYLAGFFDGEGYIGMNKRIRGKYVEYLVQVSIGQKDAEIIDYLKQNFGGTLHLVKRDGSYQWICTNQNAYKFLTTLLPYLRYKKLQAELALSFYEKKGQGRKISEEEIQRREDILQSLKDAKKVFKKSLL